MSKRLTCPRCKGANLKLARAARASAVLVCLSCGHRWRSRSIAAIRIKGEQH